MMTIKNQLQFFSSNSISSVEIANGNLKIKYENGYSITFQKEDISPELQKLKTEMEKNGDKKLTKEELEKELQKLKNQKNQPTSEKPKNKPWGLIIGAVSIAVVGLVGLVILIRLKNRKRKTTKF